MKKEYDEMTARDIDNYAAELEFRRDAYLDDIIMEQFEEDMWEQQPWELIDGKELKRR